MREIVVSIIFTLVYFLIFFPIGLILKVFKMDLLKIKIDKTVFSYWQTKTDK